MFARAVRRAAAGSASGAVPRPAMPIRLVQMPRALAGAGCGSQAPVQVVTAQAMRQVAWRAFSAEAGVRAGVRMAPHACCTSCMYLYAEQERV